MTQKCPFAAPITVGRAACRHALEVVRRGGSEYDCSSAVDHAVCVEVFGALKHHGLDAFGVEDDLTSMPHSVLVKIQTGGLDGLRRLLREAPAGSPVASDVRDGEGESAEEPDIAALIKAAAAVYGGVSAIPFEETASDMLACRLERRGRRRGG